MDSWTPITALNTMRIIHFSLFMGLLLFGAFVIFQNSQGGVYEEVSHLNLFSYVAVGMFTIAVLIVNSLFKMVLRKSLGQEPDIQKKFASYQTAHLIRMATMELPGMFAAITTFLTGSYISLGVLVLVLMFFLFRIPTVTRMEEEVGLTPDEKQQFTG